MSILILYANKLKEKDFIAFMLFVQEAIAKHPAIGQAFAKYVARVRAAYEQMNRIYLKYDNQFYTEQVKGADTKRSTAFRKMNDAIRFVSLYDSDPEKQESASMLVKIIRLYVGSDGFMNLTMAEKTAVIVNLVEDFEDKYRRQAESVGISAYVEDLKLAQQGFDYVYMQRAEIASDTGTRAMADARQRMYEAYRDFVTVVNIDAPYDTEGLYTPFIKLLNVEIEKRRRETGQGSAGAGDSSDKPSLPEEKHVTLTFEKADETVIRLTGLPGESYEIPELLPEHIWVKADGEIEAPTGIFPAEDCTYIEVALGKRKGAFYHYLSGEHETFYGLPGTEYTVPQLPEGCKWMPEPTGRIPDEDTQYFETLVPEGGSEDSENSDGSEEKPDTPPAGEEKPKYTVNWVNKGGETVKTMQVEAGTKLTASDYPKAASGYEWKPSWIGGGLTVNGNTTIREVPIEDMGV